MGNCGKPKGQCTCGQKSYNRKTKTTRTNMKMGPIVPSSNAGRINLAINNPRRFGGETFHAEAMNGARTIRWNNKAAAERRASQIRQRGFTARVVNNSVYVGPLQKRYQGMRLKPRATYDWSGTAGMSQQDLKLDY